MSLSELRNDPYAWAFARRHHQAKPQLLRALRFRRAATVLLAVGFLSGLTLAGASVLAAGPKPAVVVSELPGGGLGLTVRPDAGSEKVLEEIRAVFDDRFISVRLSTLRGRPDIVGRVIAEGHGVAMLDSDPTFDFSATSVVVTPDAEGVVSVLVATTGVFDIGSSDLACSTFGRPLAEVRAELESSGLRVQVTPVAADPALLSEADTVLDVTLMGNFVNIVTQPARELPAGAPGCQ